MEDKLIWSIFPDSLVMRVLLAGSPALGTYLTPTPLFKAWLKGNNVTMQ